MSEPDAESSWSSPVLDDCPSWLDESTPAANDRVPARGEPGSARATRRPTSAIQRRPATSIGSQGERLGTETSGGSRHACYAGHLVGMATAGPWPFTILNKKGAKVLDRKCRY